MDHGACRTLPPDLFLPEKAEAVWSYRRARKICNACPVRTACLEFAVAVGETHGMWGGLTPDERKPIVADRRHAALDTQANRFATRSV